MLVHDNVCAFWDLDGPVRQLFYCSLLNELSQDLSGTLVVLGLLLSAI